MTFKEVKLNRERSNQMPNYILNLAKALRRNQTEELPRICCNGLEEAVTKKKKKDIQTKKAMKGKIEAHNDDKYSNLPYTKRRHGDGKKTMKNMRF